MSEIRKYLILSQVSLFGLMLLCSLIMPSVFITNGGVTNFGNHLSTVVPYTLSFTLSILFMCLVIAKLLKMGPTCRTIGYALLVLCLLEFLVLMSTFPRNIAQIYSDIHNDISIILFAYELLLSGWFVFNNRQYSAVLFILIQTIGSVLGIVTILGPIHFLFIAQMIGAGGFGLIITITLPDILAKKLSITD